MKSESELMLTSSQIAAFMDNLGLNPMGELTIERLRIIIQQFLARVPFQNLTMLVGPMRRPTWSEICDEMLCGNGGLCTTRNPFLKALLERLGFDVCFVSASMVKPDCHIGLLVFIEGKEYWVDVGNGYPYIEPYPIDSGEVVSHPFFEYRIRQSGAKYMVEHRHGNGLWKENQSFETKPVPYSFFDEMHKRHYTEIGWGPFLSGLRANRWTVEDSFILRDRNATSMGVQTSIKSQDDLRNWLRDVFPSASFHSQEITKQAWEKFTKRELELTR